MEINLIDNQNALNSFELVYKDFCDCIVSLPEALFLSPMNGWSPRDIVAHLIGWNRQMIEASAAILRGDTPAYYADAPNDYCNINAGFVKQFASRSKAELLDELKSSMEDFEEFVMSLDQSEFTASHGVMHYSGRPATVEGIINALAGDYREHLCEITEWLENSIEFVVHSFLVGYGQALSVGDLPAIVNCWDTPALVLSDQGAQAILESAEVERFFGGAVEWYQAQGIMATQPRSVEIKRLSERLVSVDVRWSVISASGVERPSEHSLYILSIADDGQPRIRVAIALAIE